jgi:hypothetical protein
MTNEQINIAIAEACGWTEEDNESEICWTRDELTYCLHEDELPNYCNDLNAMHEAEKTLTKEQVRVYSDFLAYSPHESCWASCTIWHQTSRQRAEAFLKTLEKWEE